MNGVHLALRAGLLALLLGGCARDRSVATSGHAARVDSSAVTADRPREVGLPPARVESLPPPPLTALRIAPAGATHVPPPTVETEAPPTSDAPVDRLPVDDRLRPPVLMEGPRWPLERQARGWVDLDVLVDESGAVADVRVVGGTADAATQRSAIDAARLLRYQPARRGDVAVAVWCRQRFDSRR
jgi:TonB family protein